MLIGYARVSKADGSQSLDLQRDALIAAGVPALDLQQDGTRYFDLHHTPDDTLDKVDPAQLRQNVVVWTAVLAILANSSDAELP